MKFESRKNWIYLGIGAFVLIAGIAFWRYRDAEKDAIKQVDSIEALKGLLSPDGWSIPRPPRTDWTPGTLLLIESGKISVVQTGIEAFPEEAFKRFVARAPYPQVEVSLDCSVKGNLQFLTGKNRVEGSELGKRSFSVTLRDTVIRGITIDQMKDAIGKNEALKKEVARRPPQSLFVIQEALIANSISISNSAKSNTQVEESMNISDSLHATLRTSVQGKSQADYVVDGPITVGYKLYSLSAVAKTLGGGVDIKLLKSEITDQDKIGDLEQVPERVSFRRNGIKNKIHVLAIGLDLYRVSETAHIGGIVPGAPHSAAIVASRMQELVGNDPRCSVEIFAPTLTSGRIRDGVSREQLVGFLSQWRSRVKGLEDATLQNDAEKSAYIVYFCGHGVVDSTNGFVMMIPEDYGESDKFGRIAGLSWSDVAFTPNKNSSCLLIADCCRKEDGYLSYVREQFRLPFQSSWQSNLISRFRESNRSGFPGPGTLLVHAARNDTSAYAIPYKIGLSDCEIGPLAALVDRIISDKIKPGSKFTLLDLANEIMTETQVNGHKVSGEGWFNVWSEQTRDRFSGITLAGSVFFSSKVQ